MSNLGKMYANGQGVTQDYAEALKWYRKAADRGNAGAQYNLGITHYNGRGVPQDYDEALKWFRKAAERGNMLAQYNLASMYEEGRGVPQDYVQAHKWYNLATALGNEEGSKHRDGVEEKMTPADVSKAKRLAREWMAKHRKK